MKRAPQFAKRFRPLLEELESRRLLAVFHVAAGFNGNGTEGNPFGSIQQAANTAATNDTIKVAAGTYGYNAAFDITGGFGSTAAVVVLNKILHIYGGYTVGNWNSANPTANLTIIDPNYATRGVWVTTTGGESGLDMSGFTINRGLGTPASARTGDGAIFGFGGGMWAEQSHLVLNDIVFSNNVAQGAPGGDYGGVGAGGGLAVLSARSTVSLNRVQFVNNNAYGGAGGNRGGFAQGGGLFASSSLLNGTNLTFTNNRAIAGNTTLGSGLDAAGKDTADGQGGAVDVLFGTYNFANVTATNNLAQGGSAPNGLPGGGTGGAFVVEKANLAIYDSTIRDNLAQGGTGLNVPLASGRTGAFALGGGVNMTNGNLLIERSSLIGNIARGGNTSGSVQSVRGAGGGGGLSASTFEFTTNVIVANTIIADNQAREGTGPVVGGGGGGGAWFQGTLATVRHATFARNIADYQGSAIIALNFSTPFATAVNLQYSIIAGHTTGIRAINVFADATPATPAGNGISGLTNLFAGNTVGNFIGNYVSSTDINSGQTLAQLFVSPGSPNFNYHLAPGSAAIDAAGGSGETVDVDLDVRDVARDIGADERRVPRAGFSSTTYTGYEPNTGTVPVTITILRTGDTSGTDVINYTITPGTASSGSDYTGANGSVTFNPTETSKTFTVNVLSDGAAFESPETVNLAISGAIITNPANAVLTIIDAGAQGVGSFDPSTATWYLRWIAGPGGPDVTPFQFGGANWTPLIGDWNDDGLASIGVVNPANAFWYLKNTNGQGGADIGPFQYGAPGWVPVAGDWNGDGQTTIGSFDPSTATWYLRNTNGSGGPDAGQIQFGGAGWLPVVGDWDNTGTSNIGVVNPSTGQWYLRNDAGALVGGGPFSYGGAGWRPVAGDWDGNGVVGIGTVDPNTGTWYLRNATSGGAADAGVFQYGGANWRPLGGDFNGPGGAALRADGTGIAAGGSLTQSDLDRTIAAALVRLQAGGLDSETLERLGSTRFEVRNLTGNYLGWTAGDTVSIDADAAGFGWFIDGTPLDDEEFSNGLALADGPAAGRMDLLSAVLHEMGHVSGLDHDALESVLAAGVRRN